MAPSFCSYLKFGGMLASGKRNYESGSGSSGCGIVVGASMHSAGSFREAYGRSNSENNNESGVGYDQPDGSWDLNLGFLIPFPSGFDPGEFRLKGSISTCFTSPLCGSQARCGSFLLRGF